MNHNDLASHQWHQALGPHSGVDAFPGSAADVGTAGDALHFAVTAHDLWYFLECNPNGQWAWQPAPITDAVARSIADRLQNGSDT
ncbi:hypothetical protein [Streptomyces sp. NPDC005953]|uniref:hypothetical protein n=1 Tax=Streptomyces sp. NPDC005953 TaxID=3156719 RepID=UPI0033F1A6D2